MKRIATVVKIEFTVLMSSLATLVIASKAAGKNI